MILVAEPGRQAGVAVSPILQPLKMPPRLVMLSEAAERLFCTSNLSKVAIGGRLTMSDASAIEWTDATWNPVTGCSKVSPGCAHCYAERIAERFRGGKSFPDGFDLTLRPDRLSLPLQWKRPRRIFVNSMSDLFHEGVPLNFIVAVFNTMRDAYWHKYQILTKRSERLREVAPYLSWPANVWMGVSVEYQRWICRIDDLRTVPAAVRFLSLEPLLGPLSLNLEGIDWVIAGGESGPGARPMRTEWVGSIRDQCASAGVPFFFKQWGAHDATGARGSKKTSGRLLDGRTWDDMPHEALLMSAAR